MEGIHAYIKSLAFKDTQGWADMWHGAIRHQSGTILNVGTARFYKHSNALALSCNWLTRAFGYPVNLLVLHEDTNGKFSPRHAMLLPMHDGIWLLSMQPRRREGESRGHMVVCVVTNGVCELFNVHHDKHSPKQFLRDACRMTIKETTFADFQRVQKSFEDVSPIRLTRWKQGWRSRGLCGDTALVVVLLMLRFQWYEPNRVACYLGVCLQALQEKKQEKGYYLAVLQGILHQVLAAQDTVSLQNLLQTNNACLSRSDDGLCLNSHHATTWLWCEHHHRWWHYAIRKPANAEEHLQNYLNVVHELLSNTTLAERSIIRANATMSDYKYHLVLPCNGTLVDIWAFCRRLHGSSLDYHNVSTDQIQQCMRATVTAFQNPQSVEIQNSTSLVDQIENIIESQNEWDKRVSTVSWFCKTLLLSLECAFVMLSSIPWTEEKYMYMQVAIKNASDTLEKHHNAEEVIEDGSSDEKRPTKWARRDDLRPFKRET